jgi:hypothetical protein
LVGNGGNQLGLAGSISPNTSLSHGTDQGVFKKPKKRCGAEKQDSGGSKSYLVEQSPSKFSSVFVPRIKVVQIADTKCDLFTLLSVLSPNGYAAAFLNVVILYRLKGVQSY